MVKLKTLGDQNLNVDNWNLTITNKNVFEDLKGSKILKDMFKDKENKTKVHGKRCREKKQN